MAKDMFVWRKSVYDNNFKCNQCGAKLFNSKTGRPTDNLVVDADIDLSDVKEPIYCFCGKCQNAVATWQPVEAEQVDSDNILCGSYSEWIEKKAMDLNAEMQKRVEGKIAKKYEQKIQMLSDMVKSRDSTISKMKIAYETYQKEHDEENLKLHQELRHADKQIEKLQGEIKKLLDEKLCK